METDKLARGEVNPSARYRNEHVSLWSIKEANRQSSLPPRAKTRAGQE